MSFFQKQNKYLIARKFVEENNEAERFQKVVIDRLIQLEKEEEENRPFSWRQIETKAGAGTSVESRGHGRGDVAQSRSPSLVQLI